MRIKDMYKFRKRWAEDFGEYSEKLLSYVGSVYKDEHGKKFKGFFSFVCGAKVDIKDFLEKELRLTGSYQIIYELMQNANDCNDDRGAGKLFVYYNDKYLLFVNNGKPFSEENIRAICNIGQSDKNKLDNKVDKGIIGKFGIGFKLVYHLLGGVQQVINYKAPIIFSWSCKKEIHNFLNCSDFEVEDIKYPVLFKPILTAVPIHVNEEVYDLNGNKTILFKKEEIYELKKFIDEMGIKDKLLEFDRGSLFFLRLSNKQSFEKNLEEQKSEIENSLIFLRYLDEVIINGIPYKKPENIKIFPESGELSKNILIVYCPFTNILKSRPNIYCYFPVADEKYGLNFIIHAPNFEIETSRRSLLWDNNKNIEILEKAVELIEKEMENRKSDIIKYEELLYAILSSDKPKKGEIRERLYDPLKDYALKNIPCKDSKDKILFKNENEVVIKNTELNVYPEKLGIRKYWLFYNNKKTLEILKNKLKKYSIVDLINDGNIDKINNWIKNLDDEEYLKFIKELDEKLAIKNSKLEKNIKWVKFGKYYLSIDEIKERYYIYLSSLINDEVKKILEKLGFVFSYIDFCEYKNLLELFFSCNNNGEYFKKYLENICDYINNNSKDINKLSPKEKKTLFLWLSSKIPKKSKNKLRTLKLFKNKRKKITELSKMIKPNKYPEFLGNFEIDDSEYFVELDEYLCNEQEIFKKIIYCNIEDIVKNIPINKAQEFYEKLAEYYDLGKKCVTNEDIEKLKTKKFILVEIYDKIFLKSSNEVIIIEPKLLENINIKILNKCFEKFFKKYIPNYDVLCVIFNKRNEGIYYQLQFKVFDKNINLMVENTELTENEMKEYLKFLTNLGKKLNGYNVIKVVK